VARVEAGARRPRVVVLDAKSTLPALGPGSAWIYFGSDARDYFSVRARIGSRAREIPAGPLINDIVREHREEILNFDESVQPRSELRWNATDLAERNVFTSNFIHACCCALGLDRMLRTTEDDLLIVVDNALLGRRLAAIARARGREVGSPGAWPLAVARARSVAAGLAHRLLFLGRLAATRRAIRRRLDPRRKLPKLDVLLVTWADPETFSPEAPIERETYFGTLPSELRASGQSVGFLANPTTWIYPLDDILRNVASAADPVVVPEETVRLRDGVAIALRTLVSPARLSGPFEAGGLDLSGLIADELRREWSQPRQLWALQFFYVGRFLASQGRPAKVIFPFENQPWEKTLRLGLRAALPETESVGFQHTPVSEHWFPYFASRRDVAAGQLPDRLLTIGRRWCRLFAASGYPANRLEIIPALRHAHLADLRAASARGPHERSVVLVAGSIGPSDSLELVVKSLQALDEVAGTQVRIKLHPKLGVSHETFERSVRDALGRQALAANVSFVGGSVLDALRDTDVVLYNTTSVAYEALALGIPVVFVESDFWFDIDPLPAGSDVREAARTPAEIRAAIVHLLRETPAEAERRHLRAQELIGDAFA
jgi:hypothetical protein